VLLVCSETLYGLPRETLLEVVGTAEAQINNSPEHALQNIEPRSVDLVAIGDHFCTDFALQNGQFGPHNRYRVHAQSW
jgi:hypothetical protein